MRKNSTRKREHRKEIDIRNKLSGGDANDLNQKSANAMNELRKFFTWLLDTSDYNKKDIQAILNRLEKESTDPESHKEIMRSIEEIKTKLGLFEKGLNVQVKKVGNDKPPSQNNNDNTNDNQGIAYSPTANKKPSLVTPCSKSQNLPGEQKTPSLPLDFMSELKSRILTPNLKKVKSKESNIDNPKTKSPFEDELQKKIEERNKSQSGGRTKKSKKTNSKTQRTNKKVTRKEKR